VRHEVSFLVLFSTLETWIQSESMTIKVAINGAAGRMGRNLIEACVNTNGLELAAAIEHAGSEFLGNDAAALAGISPQGIKISSDLKAVAGDFDVLIDFTRPEPSIDALRICREHGKQFIVGTTGFSDEQQAEIEAAANDIAIIKASNFSVGVNLTFKLLEVAAKALGDSVDIEIIEAHHRHKVDAPSGTAISMGEVVADTLGRDLKECAVYGREGHTGERGRKEIGFETIRAGDIIGDHTVMFADIGERVEIVHKASNRIIYANGAMRGAKWLSEQSHGLFNMQDVLGFGA